MTEVIPASKRPHRTTPVILEPIFCAGIEALTEALHDVMPNRRRSVTVLEVAAIAQAVAAFLKKAPLIRRGRPKA